MKFYPVTGGDIVPSDSEPYAVDTVALARDGSVRMLVKRSAAAEWMWEAAGWFPVSFGLMSVAEYVMARWGAGTLCGWTWPA